MSEQYKCKQCGRVFYADRSNMVMCPQCKSDNIQPVSKNNYMKYILMAVLFMGMLGVGFFVSKLISPDEPESITTYDNNLNAEDAVEKTEFVEELVDSQNVSLSIKMTNLKCVKGTYTFTAVCVNAIEGEKMKWTLLMPFGEHAIVATSADGNFRGVPASNDEGTYILRAESETSSGEITVSGFEKIIGIPKGQEMTAAQLEQKINQLDKSLLAANPKVATNPILKFVGLQEDDIRPDNIQKVFNKIKLGNWERVKVVAVQYNESNCVSVITISPVYPVE